jgi:hypothetical protein
MKQRKRLRKKKKRKKLRQKVIRKLSLSMLMRLNLIHQNTLRTERIGFKLNATKALILIHINFPALIALTTSEKNMKPYPLKMVNF